MKNGAISERMNFNSLANNPSDPVALWILRFCSSFSTPCFVMFMLSIFENVGLPIELMLSSASL